MSESVGHCVIPCSRCGQSMRVEVAAELSPIQRPGWREMKIWRAGEQIGVCWWRYQAVGTDHQCPRRAPLPRSA